MIRASRNACYALLLGGLFLIAVAVLFCIQRPSEPTYQGKPLSAWLDVLGNDPEATNALRQMAPSALPFLVSMLRPKVSHLERSVWSWTYNRGIKTDSKIDRRWKAIDAFRALGPVGSPAITNLIPLLDDTNTQNAASAALAGIGSDAAIALVAALTNATPDLRIGIARTLGERHWSNASVVAAALLAGLVDEDWRIRAVSAEGLGRSGLGPFRKLSERVVPALVSSLQDTSAVVRASAAIALRHFGPEAHTGLPALIQAASTETDEDARREAEFSARRIAAEAKKSISLPPNL